MEEMGRPFLTRGLAVPDRVVGHLLGSDLPDAALASIIRPGQPVAASGVELVVAGLRADVGVIYLRQEPSAGAAELAVEACRRLDRDAVILDLDLVSTADDLAELVPAALREAALRQAVVVAGPIDHLVDDAGRPLRLLADADPPVVLTGTVSWDPGLAGRAPMFLDVGPPDEDQRAALWAENLQPTDGLDAMAETAQFRLTPLQIASAATAAAEAARAEGRTIEGADLRTGARLQNAARLERLARRIEPAVGWDDLVLPPALVRALHRLADRARHRAQVLGEWRMRPGGGRGAGVTALLSGDPGTGKTMSAEVVAGDLGLDLYVVNLATVVDKYVGETEKNLDRIFTEAAGVNGVLLFDEADALFGQRSEVRDSHDRYANLEVAYLLQRMEAFDGLALLATNLRANIDEAFARRLDAILDFPNPDAGLRRRLWEKCLATVPAAPDLDLDYCAEAFDLAGGNVRSIAITAAYRAAAGSRQVTMPDLVASIGDEYRKLGRLCLEAEFGPYHHLASS
jgi:hypothetical protein